MFPLSRPVPLSPPATFGFFLAVYLPYFLAGLYLSEAFGILGLFLNQVVFLFFPCVFISRVYEQNLDEWEIWKPPLLRDFAIAIVWILFILLGVDLLMELQNRYWPPPVELEKFFEQITQIRSVSEGILKSIIMVVAAAFFEEIFFRGILQPNFINWVGIRFGLLMTASLFALAHGNFRYFHFYLILGILLGGLKEWRQSLWLPIVAHAINNGWVLIQSHFQAG